jgi:hypothetical protein
MSAAEKIADAALKEAARLGLLATVGKTLVAIVTGKPTLAARLAQNDALAAGAVLAAERRKAKR